MLIKRHRILYTNVFFQHTFVKLQYASYCFERGVYGAVITLAQDIVGTTEIT